MAEQISNVGVQACTLGGCAVSTTICLYLIMSGGINRTGNAHVLRRVRRLASRYIWYATHMAPACSILMMTNTVEKLRQLDDPLRNIVLRVLQRIINWPQLANRFGLAQAAEEQS
jgi:hypothetical protein